MYFEYGDTEIEYLKRKDKKPLIISDTSTGRWTLISSSQWCTIS